MRKKLVALLLTALTVFALIPIGAVEAFAETVSARTVYLDPGVANADNPVWYAWTWGSSNSRWVEGVADNGKYKFTGVDSSIIFVRMNPNGNVPSWDNGTKWNQTGDLTPDDSENLYTITGWNNGNGGNMGGNWSAYTEPTSETTTAPVITTSATTVQATTAPATQAPTQSPTQEQSENRTIYLNATAVSSGEECWYAYSWSENSNKWVMGVNDSKLVRFDNVYSNIIFLRFNKTVTSPDWDSPDLWNRTGDLNAGENDMFTITIWHGDKYGNMCGNWSKHSSVKPEGAHGNKDLYFYTGTTDTSVVKWYVWTWADGDNGYWVTPEVAGQYFLAHGVCNNFVLLCTSADYYAPLWETPVKKYQTNDLTFDNELYVLYSLSDSSSGYWTSFHDFEHPSASSENKPKYSDLFYRYSNYLSNSYLNNYTDYAFNTMDMIESDFSESGDYYLMSIKTAINSSLDLTSWGKLISDATGKTDFQFQQSLDAANIKLVNEIVGSANTQYNDLQDVYGTSKKMVKHISTAFTIVNGLYESILKDQTYNETTIDVYLNDVIDYVSNGGSLFYVKQHAQYMKKEYIDNKTSLSKIGAAFKKAGNMLDFTKALVLALAMENMRLEVVDDIIDNTPDESYIHQGMEKLKTQLDEGFVSYFFYNYIEQNLIDKVVGAVKDTAIEAVIGNGPALGVVKSCINIASMVVFDYYLHVPDLDDYTTQLVLTEYCCDLENSMRNIINNDFSHQFESTVIKEFETICGAYSACVRASLDNCESLAQESNIGNLHIAQNYFGDIDFYSQYIDSVKFDIIKTPESYLKPVFTGDWITSPDGLDTLAGASDDVEYDNKSIYSGINGTLVVSGNLYVAWMHSFKMDGNIRFKDVSAKLINYGELNVLGDVQFDYGSIENNGTITVCGNCEAEITQDHDYSKLIVKGNLFCYSHISNGKVIADGQNKAQYIQITSVKDFEADNPKGIEAHFKVWGELKLNQTSVSSYSLIGLCSTTKLNSDNCNYGKLMLTEPFTLTQSITADIVSNTVSGNTLTIPEGADVTITGSININPDKYNESYLHDDNSRDSYPIYNYPLTIINNGSVTVTENVDHFTERDSELSLKNYGSFKTGNLSLKRIEMPESSSTLELKGDLYLVDYSESYINGKLSFNGKTPQKANGLRYADIIELNNTTNSGVTFDYSLEVTTLFNHNGNNFTLCGSNNSISNYDGDAMTDDKDPYPLDKNNLKGTAGTVKFLAPAYWNSAKCYVWSSKYGGAPVAWPGTDMTFISTESDGKKLYKASFDTNAFDKIIFTNGYGTQTDDLSVQNGKCFLFDTNEWADYTSQPQKELDTLINKTVGPDSADTNFSMFGFLPGKTYGALDLLGVQKKGDGTNSLRFVSAVSSELLSDKRVIDYGYIFTSTSKATLTAKQNAGNLNIENGKKYSCKGTYNTMTGSYGGEEVTDTPYKYVTAAVNNVDENKAVVARFYIQTEGETYYASYTDSSGEAFKGCAARFSELTN